MSDSKMKPLAASLRQVFDRKLVAGMVIGVSVMVAGYAVSATDSLSTTLGIGTSTGVAAAQEVVAAEIKSEEAPCAEGAAGTIGGAIAQAVLVHSELAAATANVESLFDVGSDCFSGLSQIYDLSFTIPSLASIISAAQSAVLTYAQKKVCSAVKQVTGLVTSPINQAIAKINTMSSIGDLNGLSNGLVSKGMSSIDPALGAEYHSTATAGATYSVGTNPFSATQTSFDTTSTTTTTAPAAATTTTTTATTTATATKAAAVSSDSSWVSSVGELFK